MSQFTVDPDAVLDYQYDWSKWLAAGETIIAHTLTPTEGITVDSSSRTGGIVTVWLSSATLNATHQVTCHIVTDQGRQDDRTIKLRVAQR